MRSIGVAFAPGCFLGFLLRSIRPSQSSAASIFCGAVRPSCVCSICSFPLLSRGGEVFCSSARNASSLLPVCKVAR